MKSQLEKAPRLFAPVLKRKPLYKSLQVVGCIALLSGTAVAQTSDADNDGVPDLVEIAEQTDPVNTANFLDSHGDGVPDFLDNDSDGDNVLDFIEIGGDPYLDQDGDGVPVYLDDNDTDTSVGNGDGRISSQFDPDGNNTAAFQDSLHDHEVDSDGDLVPDSIEISESTNPLDPSSFADTDRDGVPDYVEFDSDNDGICLLYTSDAADE